MGKLFSTTKLLLLCVFKSSQYAWIPDYEEYREQYKTFPKKKTYKKVNLQKYFPKVVEHSTGLCVADAVSDLIYYEYAKKISRKILSFFSFYLFLIRDI